MIIKVKEMCCISVKRNVFLYRKWAAVASKEKIKQNKSEISAAAFAASQPSTRQSGSEKQLSLGDIHICLHAVALMMIRANLLITISTVTVLFSAKAIST